MLETAPVVNGRVVGLLVAAVPKPSVMGKGRVVIAGWVVAVGAESTWAPGTAAPLDVVTPSMYCLLLFC